MVKLKIGDKAIDFCLNDKSGKKVCLKDHKNKWIVLYFYPKDNTSGCTLEAMDFTKHVEEFNQLGATILGVSPDSVQSHQNFSDKNNLKIQLLSDESHETLEKYGVWQEKSMYGNKYFGVVRSTLIINPKGVVSAIWDSVKVPNHVEEVKQKLIELQK